MGPEPAAAIGGNGQAERREPQGAAESRDYVCSPEETGRLSVGNRKERLKAATMRVPRIDEGGWRTGTVKYYAQIHLQTGQNVICTGQGEAALDYTITEGRVHTARERLNCSFESIPKPC